MTFHKMFLHPVNNAAQRGQQQLKFLSVNFTLHFMNSDRSSNQTICEKISHEISASFRKYIWIFLFQLKTKKTKPD